jgi:electron transfer flavoprotein alpha subunit
MEHQGVYQGVWILAEQTGGKIGRISFELITRGRQLADKRKTDLTALLIGGHLEQAQLASLIQAGADRVLAVESPKLLHFLVEPYARSLLHVIAQYKPEIIIAGATSTGRTLMPYVAIRANTGLTADCTVLDIEDGTGNLLQTRPAIGGNILATIKTPNHRPQLATVRPHSTRPAEAIPSRQASDDQITRIAAPPALLTSRVTRVDFVPNAQQLGLQEADAVVVAGRGIKKGDNVPLVAKLADSLGAALGATRDVVDRGWLSYSHQVGLSGKTITPKLYIGVGVSGSIQHLAGMQTAENILAINSDSQAQIFRVADIGIVGDLFEIVPALTAAIRKAKQSQPI